jgi:hypothetical protein
MTKKEYAAQRQAILDCYQKLQAAIRSDLAMDIEQWARRIEQAAIIYGATGRFFNVAQLAADKLHAGETGEAMRFLDAAMQLTDNREQSLALEKVKEETEHGQLSIAEQMLCIALG